MVMGEPKVADVRAQVSFSLFTDFENFKVFKPQARSEAALHGMLDQVIAWGGALKACGTGACRRPRPGDSDGARNATCGQGFMPWTSSGSPVA